MHKYDHVTLHHRELNWLPVSLMVQLQSIATMLRYFQQRETLQLDPLYCLATSIHMELAVVIALLTHILISYPG